MIANNSSPLVELSDSEVLAQTLNAARNERVATARLIQLLMEVDQRRVYLGEGCSSLFTDCTQVLRLSEHAAYNRIESVARCMTNCDEHRTCCAMRCRTAIRRSSSRGRSNYCLRSSSERASVQSHTLERCVNPTTLRVMFPLQSDERSGSAMRVAAHFAVRAGDAPKQRSSNITMSSRLPMAGRRPRVISSCDAARTINTRRICGPAWHSHRRLAKRMRSATRKDNSFRNEFVASENCKTRRVDAARRRGLHALVSAAG